MSENIVLNNIVKGSGGDGIQVQSDYNTIQENSIIDNGGAAIKICGIGQEGDCVNPFDQWDDAIMNSIIYNNITDDNIGGEIIDNGVDTQYPPPKDDEDAGDDQDDGSADGDESSTETIQSTQDGATAVTSTKVLSSLIATVAAASSLPYLI